MPPPVWADEDTNKLPDEQAHVVLGTAEGRQVIQNWQQVPVHVLGQELVVG
jgi:hypothetical protein